MFPLQLRPKWEKNLKFNVMWLTVELNYKNLTMKCPFCYLTPYFTFVWSAKVTETIINNYRRPSVPTHIPIHTQGGFAICGKAFYCYNDSKCRQRKLFSLASFAAVSLSESFCLAKHRRYSQMSIYTNSRLLSSIHSNSHAPYFYRLLRGNWRSSFIHSFIHYLPALSGIRVAGEA